MSKRKFIPGKVVFLLAYTFQDILYIEKYFTTDYGVCYEEC